MDNKRFYKSSAGEEIMLSCNFNEDVITFLQAEAPFVSRALSFNKYDTLVDLGCNTFKNYHLADLHKINYIGIDIRDFTINNLEKSSSNSATFYCFDFLDTKKLSPLIKNKKSLCLFPFNLAGNISDINHLLMLYKEIDIAIILSMWQCSDKADMARKQYYNNCGLKNIILKKTDISHNFISNNFVSKSYKGNTLDHLINKHGFNIHNKYSNEVIQCWHFSIK